MNTLKKMMLGATVVLSLTNCGDGTNMNGTGGGSGGGAAGGGAGGGGGTADCVSTPPVSNLDFLNACPDASIEKVLKDTPWRAAGTTLPMLP